MSTACDTAPVLPWDAVGEAKGDIAQRNDVALPARPDCLTTSPPKRAQAASQPHVAADPAGDGRRRPRPDVRPCRDLLSAASGVATWARGQRSCLAVIRQVRLQSPGSRSASPPDRRRVISRPAAIRQVMAHRHRRSPRSPVSRSRTEVAGGVAVGPGVATRARGGGGDDRHRLGRRCLAAIRQVRPHRRPRGPRTTPASRLGHGATVPRLPT
jgi:hypothetical protein